MQYYNEDMRVQVGLSTKYYAACDLFSFTVLGCFLSVLHIYDLFPQLSP